MNAPDLRPLAFLVDLDGVLVRSHELHLAAYERAFHQHGLELSADARHLVLHGAARERVLSDAGVPEPVSADVSESKEAAFLDLLADGALLPARGAERFLRTLGECGCPAVLVSNSATAGRCVEALGWGWAFAHVVEAGSWGRAKPHPDPFRTAAGLVGVPADRCVAVEDSPAGAASARAAGTFVVGVGGRLAAGDVDLLVPELGRIPARRWLSDLPSSPPPESAP